MGIAWPPVPLHRLLRTLAGALALLATVGCGSGETSLRITVLPGSGPTPMALRLTVTGVTAAPRLVSPVKLPGTLVVHGLPATATELCVQIDGLDASLALTAQAATTVTLQPHETVEAIATLASPSEATRCGPLCPPGAYFCDDFEADDLSTHWTALGVNQAGGRAERTTARAAHGVAALHAYAAGTPSGTATLVGETYADEELTPIAPPLALRANVLTPAPLAKYSMVLALYDAQNDGFAIGGDDQGTWVVTEDQARAPDHHGNQLPTTANQWHCVELVIDAAGQVSAYVDGDVAVPPFARQSAVAYSRLHVGIERTIVTGGIDVYVDDVALAAQRIGCE
jgi:hypothetical protein